MALSQRSETAAVIRLKSFAGGNQRAYKSIQRKAMAQLSATVQSRLWPREKWQAEIVLYSVNTITSGSTESQGEVSPCRLHCGKRVVNGGSRS